MLNVFSAPRYENVSVAVAALLQVKSHQRSTTAGIEPSPPMVGSYMCVTVDDQGVLFVAAVARVETVTEEVAADIPEVMFIVNGICAVASPNGIICEPVVVPTIHFTWLGFKETF